MGRLRRCDITVVELNINKERFAKKILTEKEHGSDDVRKVLGNYKYGETTDFGMMMGAATHYDMDDPGKLFSYYWIIPDGHGKPFNLRNYGVRPVVKYTDIKSEAKEISKTPYLVVEYGEYPQSVVSPEMSIELDKNYNYGSIVETGKVYTNDEMSVTVQGGNGNISDLVVTCTSKLSRNYQAGYLIGSGDNLEEALSKMTMVVEGARTCISAYQVSKKLNVYTPIIDGVYDVIYNHEKPEDVVFRLMSKTLKPERY